MRFFVTFASLCGAAVFWLGATSAWAQPAQPGQPAQLAQPAQPADAGASVSSPQAPLAGAPPSEAYRINAGDDLEINVWGEERLQRDVRVLPDGTFTFPLVGQIVAVNKLPSEVAVEITNGLKAQYRDNVPTVTVSVKAAGGFQFTVTGKVKAPGTFTPSRYVNVLDALIMAGGPAEFANVDNVIVVRRTGNGHDTSLRVRLAKVFKGRASPHDLADLPELESGDTVIVP